VTCRRTELVFDYTGKSAKHREHAVADERVCAVVRSLKQRRDGGEGLLAAVGLAVSERASGSESARKRAITRVVREVSGYLGTTPAVARASYIDPRVISLYGEAPRSHRPWAGWAGRASSGAGHAGSGRGSRAAVAGRPACALTQAARRGQAASRRRQAARRTGT